MTSPAADLAKKHALEGTPDPFPPSREEPLPMKPKPSTNGRVQEELDTQSHTLFPALGSSSSGSVSAPTQTAWISAPRIKSAASRQPVVSDSFALQVDLSKAAGKDGKPVSVGEAMKQVMSKYKVKLEASTNQKTQTTFHIKADSQKELDKAKRTLLALLSPAVTLVINAPASTIASIIGPKGATLRQIRDQTNVRIDIPRKDSLTPSNGSDVETNRKTSPTPDGEEEEELTVPITITGPEPWAYEAQAHIQQIIGPRISRTVQHIRNVPAHIFPFVAARRADFEAVAGGHDVDISFNVAELEVTVNGDRCFVPQVVEDIKSTIEGLKEGLTSIKLSLPKLQHCLFVGNVAEEIMENNRCLVDVSNADDSSDEVKLWGLVSDLPIGYTAVMEKAKSQYVDGFPVPGPVEQAQQILTYMTCIGYGWSLEAAHGVSVHLPGPGAEGGTQLPNIKVIGEKSTVDAAIRQLAEFCEKMVGSTQEVPLDWLIHRFISEKNEKKLKQLHDAHNVLIYFPSEWEERPSVLLVYDPPPLSGSAQLSEKKKHLDEVSKELSKMAKDAGDSKSETLRVDKKWHGTIMGRGGTTLNAIIGEDNVLSIKVGAKAGDPLTEDIILVRGVGGEVDRAVKAILQIVENAKNDDIVNTFSTEFDIDREFVGRIVKAQGSGIIKLRDQLGVRVDVFDETEDKEKEVGKKKKGAHPKSKIKITGRKENVEEAKKRILTQVEKLADETSETLKISNQYHSSLIGQNGKYVIRLEEKYSVKITFPRQSLDSSESKTREQLKPDEVLIKGGKKGVAAAKTELLDAVEFEKEFNNAQSFTVPARSIARIVGKGGASIKEIKETTETQVDIDRGTEDNGVVHITVRGTKTAAAAAKAAILAIANQVGEEASVSVLVESRFHRTLIGAGGQGLKDLVARCGGPSDPKALAGLIRFPRQGEPSNEVALRGEAKLVERLKAELEQMVAALRDRSVIAVGIPAAQHRAMIGRGGQNLNDFQTRMGVQIQFPGSRSYHQMGEPENSAEMQDVDSADIVKICGPLSACQTAINELKGHVKTPAPDGVTTTILVPLKYRSTILQQGNLFRTLRSSGVHVEQSAQQQKSTLPARPSARIDDPESGVAGSEIEWETMLNYQDVEEGDDEWTLKARDHIALEEAQKTIQEAIEHAKTMSHVGFLTLPDRSAFPRIVGSKGANIARLRAETGADITVSREDNTIVIIGTESSILSAKEAIVRMTSNSSRPQRRRE